VIVDRFLGERDLRVSPLDARLGKVPNVNSSSVLDNGWPVLIVDVEDRIRGLDAGADAYLAKSSFHDRTFLSTVADLIGGARE
jgi:chemotaxis protein histidine kinase CheA